MRNDRGRVKGVDLTQAGDTPFTSTHLRRQEFDWEGALVVAHKNKKNSSEAPLKPQFFFLNRWSRTIRHGTASLVSGASLLSLFVAVFFRQLWRAVCSRFARDNFKPQFMDSIYGLVSVWVRSRNECENNYESQGFVRGLKKDLRGLLKQVGTWKILGK